MRLCEVLLQQYSGVPLPHDLYAFNTLAAQFSTLPLHFLTYHGQHSVESVVKVCVWGEGCFFLCFLGGLFECEYVFWGLFGVCVCVCLFCCVCGSYTHTQFLIVYQILSIIFWDVH